MPEKIQRRATKLIPRLINIGYEQRLKECGQTTLETPRLIRGPNKSVLKILNCLENIDPTRLFVKLERSMN